MLTQENLEKVLEIVNGCLLGDGNIKEDKYKNKRYFTFKLTAKDRNLLEWVEKKLNSLGIDNTWITEDRKKVFNLNFYLNKYKIPELLNLRDKWYQKENGKTIKVVPRDLKLTPTTLFFWYLGDGSLIRRRNDKTRVPYIVLATNSFRKEDVEFLREKLKELGLNFYIVESNSISGFTKKRKKSYLLFSSTEDDTVFKFFKIIGFYPPKEIEDRLLGYKGKIKKERRVKDKWPNEEDWIKILSNVIEIGKIIRERRKELGISQKKLAELIGIRRENIRDFELMKRRLGVEKFEKVLKELRINPEEIFKNY